MASESVRHRIGDKASLVWRKMSRTKTFSDDVMETPLKRCLTTFDISLLGIGHMVGAGIYVLIGTVAKDTAGPAIILSFMLAGFTSALSALCYAEFGAQVPKAGSAYVYTYVTIGEFWAFIIGWDIILEHMIGAASVARAWSGYVDSLFGGAISNASSVYFMPMHETFLAPYPDPLAFFVTLICCGFLIFGVKEASYFNSFFTLINLSVMTFVILVGIFFADIKNWQTEGGFAPFGFSGILAGAATSFYAYVGFDSIATAGEEAIDPARSIPHATFISMGVVTVAYVLVSAILTLMVPYYELNPAASLPDAFATRGIFWAKYIISVGALAGMTTTLFGGLFALPRCTYSMASDGLFFSWFAKVSDKTKVPVMNMVICGFVTAFLALILDIEKLVQFMSIGTLVAYTIVSASVIILRYKDSPSYTPEISYSVHDQGELMPNEEKFQFEQDKKPLGELSVTAIFFSKIPQAYANSLITAAVVVFTASSASLAALMVLGASFFTSPIQIWAIFLAVFLLIIIATCVVFIALHKESNMQLSFKVPLVPYLPLLSIFLNVVLVVHLSPMTWLRYLVWLLIGFLIYFCYGIRNSKEGEVSDYTALLVNDKLKQEKALEAVHETLAKVSTKIANTAESVSKSVNKETTEKSDTKPIIDEEQ